MSWKAVEPNSNAWLVPDLGTSHAFEWREWWEPRETSGSFGKDKSTMQVRIVAAWAILRRYGARETYVILLYWI
jgi:hypothetical protein